MTRLEKCKILEAKGYTYNPETGQIFGSRGKEITNKSKQGYIQIMFISNKHYSLRGHHFAWYMSGRDMDFIEIDHDNTDKSDNRICNLRIISHQQNAFNTNAKGFSWDKSRNKWSSQIHLNGKKIYLGRFNTKEEAREAYINAKKKYHKI